VQAWTTPEQDIRAAGLRCTRQRLAVLEVLRARPRHLPVDDVAAEVRTRIGSVSVQAVYDALTALVGVGLARRVRPGGGAAYFEAADGAHHHLVCRRCGALADVTAAGAPPAPESTHGYEVDAVEVTYWGACPACRQTPEPTERSQP
jgi:Fe2+ or Zn2+ uptake regulation protein